MESVEPVRGKTADEFNRHIDPALRARVGGYFCRAKSRMRTGDLMAVNA